MIREQNLTTNISVSGLSPMHNLTEKLQAVSYILFQVTSSTQRSQVPHNWVAEPIDSNFIINYFSDLWCFHCINAQFDNEEHLRAQLHRTIIVPKSNLVVDRPSVALCIAISIVRLENRLHIIKNYDTKLQAVAVYQVVHPLSVREGGD